MIKFVHIQGPPLGCDKFCASFSEENSLRQTEKNPKKVEILMILTIFLPPEPQKWGPGGVSTPFWTKMTRFLVFLGSFLSILGPGAQNLLKIDDFGHF